MTRLLRAAGSFGLIVLSLLIVIKTSRAQDATENKGSSNVISGTVSIRDGGTLPNARVSVGQVTGGVGTRGQVLRLDSSGHFETQPLEPGLYWVSVFAPGYISENTQTPAPASWYRPGDTVSLSLTKGGVITGVVKNANGDPIVAIPVRAIMVKNKDGKVLQLSGSYREGLTDDRGIYRLYGLPSGTYVVSAGGPSRSGFTASGASAFETYVPTYAPSATRDGAAEIVLNGDEVTADVQFREEHGHVISGTIAGSRTSEFGFQNYGVGISLFDVRNRFDAGNGSANPTNNSSFALYGVPDGEYELYASQGSSTGDSIMSSAKQIKVQGADVSGISLALAAPGSIEGRIILESDPKAACGKHKTDALLETMVYARRYSPDQPKTAVGADVPYPYRNSARPATTDVKGNLEIKNLQPGSYRIDPREPATGWFVKSITLGPAARLGNVARDGVTLKNGDRASGINVTISEGAAELVGRITLGEGQSLASNVRVYLVPFEREAADNPLRFFEARPESNGKFTIDYIAPGRYFIIARAAEENEYGTPKPIRFDTAFRTKVLQDASASKKDIAFNPCAQTLNYELPLTVSTSPQ
jgi:hypothetical protein